MSGEVSEFQRGVEVGIIRGMLMMGVQGLATYCHPDSRQEIEKIGDQFGLVAVFDSVGSDGKIGVHFVNLGESDFPTRH